MNELLFIAGAYLLGSIPFAILMSLAFKLPDPRTYGSQNPGATNVLRSGKKAAAALTLFGDAFKGWLAVWLTQHYFPGQYALVSVVAIVVFLGHIFSLFLKFKGGKGVATALGVLLALNVLMGLIALGVWLAVAGILRYSSLAALVAAVSAPMYAIFSVKIPGWYIIATFVMSALLIWRHQGNIRKLLAGEEAKIGGKK